MHLRSARAPGTSTGFSLTRVYGRRLARLRTRRCAARACKLRVPRLTDRTNRRTDIVSTVTISYCSIHTPKRSRETLRWSDAHFGYRIGTPRGGSIVRSPRQRFRACPNASSSIRLSHGVTIRPPRTCRGAIPIDVRDARARLHDAVSGRPGSRCAARFSALSSPPALDYMQTLGHYGRSNCYPFTPTSTTARSSRSGCATIGAITRSASSPRIRST